MQTVASVVFIFFFSQKEFPTERIDRWWPYSKTLYMGLWGFSFFVLGYKNIPSHAEIGFSSNFFSERHMLVIWDPKDKESFREKYLRTMASDMDTKKISKETGEAERGAKRQANNAVSSDKNRTRRAYSVITSIILIHYPNFFRDSFRSLQTLSTKNWQRPKNTIMRILISL